MCVAVPMKLVKVGDGAEAELDGLVCRVNVALIDNPQVGDYVIVHAGVAIERLAPEAAAEQLQLWADLASVLRGEG